MSGWWTCWVFPSSVQGIVLTCMSYSQPSKQRLFLWVPSISIELNLLRKMFFQRVLCINFSKDGSLKEYSFCFMVFGEKNSNFLHLHFYKSGEKTELSILLSIINRPADRIEELIITLNWSQRQPTAWLWFFWSFIFLCSQPSHPFFNQMWSHRPVRWTQVSSLCRNALG